MIALSFISVVLFILPSYSLDEYSKDAISDPAHKNLDTNDPDGGKSQPLPIRDILDFDIDNQGRIGFYRMEDGWDATFVLVEPSGKVCFEIPLKVSGAGMMLPRVRFLGSDRWIFFNFETKSRGKTKAWIVDTHSGTVQHLEQLDCPATWNIAPDHKGGFVAYVTVSQHFGSGPSWFKHGVIISFDSSGRERWRVSGEGQTGVRRLPFSASITVTGYGKIVLLDQNNENLIVFDQEARLLGVMKSGASHHCVPDSNEIRPGRYGGVVVYSPYGEPTIWHVPIGDLEHARPEDSGVRSQSSFFGRKPVQAFDRTLFKPRYANGEPFSSLRGVRAAPNGRLWACDGDAIVRLDDYGVVDAVLGQESCEDAHHEREPSQVTR